MTGIETKMTRDELLAELKEHGIDVAALQEENRELQARADRNFAAVKLIGEVALKAGRLIRGEEEPDGD